ncbi:MAG: NTP transferase domain-containing protein [Desulfobacterales bacterium]
MGIRSPRFSIVLAAGEGTRMGSATRQKVCSPVNGLPAIHQALKTYNQCGIRQHIIVVGALAGQVVETVGLAIDNAIFVYQTKRLGTAHAAQRALKVLEGLDVEHDVLLVAGDRIIKPSILNQLFDLYYSQNCDLAILAVPGRPNACQGHLVTGANGQVMGIVEAADMRQRQVLKELRDLAAQGLSLDCDSMHRMVEMGFSVGGEPPPDDKYRKAFGELWHALAVEKRNLTAEDIFKLIPDHMTRFEFSDDSAGLLSKTPAEVEKAEWLNTSVYLIKTEVLRYALTRLDRNNAQQEAYLSGMVNVLSQVFENGRRRYRLKFLPVTDTAGVLGFNNPSELVEVEALIGSHRENPAVTEVFSEVTYRTIGDWLSLFEDPAVHSQTIEVRLRQELIDIYGAETEILQERIQAYLSILRYAGKVIGLDKKVFIVRSPGRVNAMGRHIDHQGGICNLMTIGYETLLVVGPREDDRVRLFNLESEFFPNREFSIGEMIAALPGEDWLALVNSQAVSDMVRNSGGDWAEYVKAAVLRLQKKFNFEKLKGMDLVVSGNIPMAAGLSSSSTLVVGAAEATVTINRLDVSPVQLVDLCGEGEWFVGTRGGAADHAAIKFGQNGQIVKVTFFEFSILDIVPFPRDYALVVCDSGLKAQKTGNARDLFNHRICCYRIGFLLIKKHFPQFASAMRFLRDVNPKHLNLPLSGIYRILLRLPETATRDELRAFLPDADLNIFFNQHAAPPDGLYPIRGVVLFGLAEMARAKLFTDAMKESRVETIGRLMNVSHDGDRVISIHPDHVETPYQAPTSNEYIQGLIEDLESGDPARVNRAQIQWQPGSYHCSLPEIDRMVDISLQTPGVAGAQLAGAGLGGCIMVFTRRDAVSNLVHNLSERYYTPAEKPPTILVCRPIAGSSFLFAEPGR